MKEEKNRVLRAGFTLVEMLLVVTIIGILATMAVIKIGGQTEVARRETTRGTIATISQAIQLYGLTHSGLPDVLEDLTVAPSEDVEAPLDKSGLFDAWGQPIQYKKISKVKYELRSGGPDKQIGTEDDLTN